MADLRVQNGAPQWVAPLFFFLLLLLVATVAVEAKMRLDRLSIVVADGREVPIEVEVAEDQQDKSLGLMFRTELPDHKGMLFPYENARELSMWMHNTYISLDMLFIRSDGVIHRIEVRAEPLSDRVINSQGPVSAVLELAGGAAERLGIKVGDQVRHPLFMHGKP